MDNLTAECVINNKIQPKRTKAMDMRFHWLRNPEAQGQLRIYWQPGKTNLANYFTKHQPPHAPCQRQVRIFYQNQRSYRSETSESGTRTDQIQVSQQLNSYKGVLDFLVTYVRTEVSYDS